MTVENNGKTAEQIAQEQRVANNKQALDNIAKLKDSAKKPSTEPETIPDSGKENKAESDIKLSRRDLKAVEQIEADFGIKIDTANVTPEQLAMIKMQRQAHKATAKVSYAGMEVSPSTGEEKDNKRGESASEDLEWGEDADMIDESVKEKISKTLENERKKREEAERKLAEVEQSRQLSENEKRTAVIDGFFDSLKEDFSEIFGEGSINELNPDDEDDSDAIEERNRVVAKAFAIQDKAKKDGEDISLKKALQKALEKCCPKEYRAVEERKENAKKQRESGSGSFGPSGNKHTNAMTNDEKALEQIRKFKESRKINAAL